MLETGDDVGTGAGSHKGGHAYPPPAPPAVQAQDFLVQPTQLVAHHKMLAEASAFQPHLELLRHDLRDYLQRADRFLRAVQEFSISAAPPVAYTWPVPPAGTLPPAGGHPGAPAAASTAATAAAERAAVPAGADMAVVPVAETSARGVGGAGGGAAGSKVEGPWHGRSFLAAACAPSGAAALLVPLLDTAQGTGLFRYEVQRESARGAQGALDRLLKQSLLPALDLWLKVYQHCKEQLPEVDALRQRHDAANVERQQAAIAAAAKAVTQLAAAAGALSEEATNALELSAPTAGAGGGPKDALEAAAAARKDLAVLATALQLQSAPGPGSDPAAPGGTSGGDAGEASPHSGDTPAPGDTTVIVHPTVVSEVGGEASGGGSAGVLEVVSGAGEVEVDLRGLPTEDRLRLAEREAAVAELAMVLQPRQERLLRELSWLVSAGGAFKGWLAHILQACLAAAASRQPPMDLLQPFPDHLIVAQERAAGASHAGST